MKIIRIGVLGPSEIANRRMIPGIVSSDKFIYCGVAYAGPEEWGGMISGWNDPVIDREKKKAEAISERFGGKVYDGYSSMLEDKSIDAVYIPLPPGLHAKWGKKALECGKHILLEKPFTTCLTDSESLITIASNNGLAVHEDFAFIFHKQIEKIVEIINSGEIGEIRLIRTSFGFPYRGESDFRYHKAMGGGALLDCGGYPICLANYLLGGNAIITASSLCPAKGHDVDVFGSATLSGDNGITAQISFGMDNSYKCDVEIWGSKGILSTGRVFSPPAELSADILLKTDKERHVFVDPDDQFRHSAEYFADCILNEKNRIENYKKIIIQSKLFEAVKNG